MDKKKIIKRIVKIGAAAVLVVVLCFGGYTVYNFYTRTQRFSNAAEVFANAVSFTVAPAERSDVQEIIATSGVVYLNEETSIYSESSEKIKDVYFSEGDYINEGDIIVTYDVSETVKTLNRKINDAQISLENAQLSLKSLALPISETEVAKIRDAFTTAEKNVYDRNVTLSNTLRDIDLKLAEIEKAEKTVENNKTLLDIGAITKDEYDKSIQAVEDLNISLDKLYSTKEINERDLESAKTAMETADYNYEHAYDVLTEESSRIKYKQQENSVRSAEIALAQAKEDLAAVVYETVSPVSGTVTAVSAVKGQSVPVGGSLYTVADFGSLIVKADISEYDAPKLALSQNVNMVSDGIADTVYTGKITKIASSAVTKSTAGGSESVVAVEITIDNPDGVLKPGYNLDVDIIAVDLKNVLNITQAALLRESQTKKYYVYTVNEENIAVKKYIETGLYGDINVEITEGLTEGEKIVTNPSDQLSEGMFVITGRPGMGNRQGFTEQNTGGNNIFRSLFGGAPTGGGGNNVRIQNGNRSNGSYQAVPSGGAAPSGGSGGGFAPRN